MTACTKPMVGRDGTDASGQLEQCRMALLKPDRGTTVDTVMRKYRFNNRARFAATYRDALVTAVC